MAMHPIPVRAHIQERSVQNRALAFGLLAAVQTTLILAITVLAIGLPAIARDLGLRPGQLALVSAGYGLAFSALLLPGGRLADRLGPRRAFLVGVAVLGLASVGVAAAPGFAAALAARLGQGVGAALAAPAAVALLRGLYPDPDAYGRASARWGTLAPIGATAGIVVSGLAAAADVWRVGPLIPAAVALVALLAGARLLPAPPPTPSTTIDVPGAVLAVVGGTTLSYALTAAGDHGWSAPPALVALVVAVAALAGFVIVEATTRAPLVPPSFLRSPGRGLALGAVLLAAAAHASTGFFLALYFQQVRGRSALATTAAFLPLLLALPLAGAVATRLLRVVRPLPLVAAGLAVSAAGLGAIGRLGPDTPYVGPLLLGLLALPVGIALTFTAATVVAVHGADRAQAGLAGALLNTAVELGPAVGLAGLVAVAGTRTTQLAERGQPPLVAQAGGYALAFTVAALALAAAAVGVALALRRGRPPESAGARPDSPTGPEPNSPSRPETGPIDQLRTGPHRPGEEPDAPTRKGTDAVTQRFIGKVAIVTGAGAGIGRATAVALAEEGATVVVAGRRAEPLAETVDIIAGKGGTAEAIPTDVTDAAQVARLVAETVRRHGGLHVAVNNAGVIGPHGPLDEVDEAAWHEVLATNLTGVWLSLKYEVAHMRRHGGGTIVNVASTIGPHLTLPGMGAYAATKAGVSALTRAAAKENIRHGIRINAVSPGPVDTPMSRRPGESDADRDARVAAVLPIGRVARVSEIAAAIVWLASPESGFTVGHDLVVDGAGTY